MQARGENTTNHINNNLNKRINNEHECKVGKGTSSQHQLGSFIESTCNWVLSQISLVEHNVISDRNKLPPQNFLDGKGGGGLGLLHELEEAVDLCKCLRIQHRVGGNPLEIGSHYIFREHMERTGHRTVV